MIHAADTLIDVDALVPDGIEPVEAMRCWHFESGKLRSLNGEEWTPMRPLEAVCRGSNAVSYSWSIVRGGMNYEAASDWCNRINEATSVSFTFYIGRPGTPVISAPMCPKPWSGALPDGYGFQLDTVKHEAPHENCTCGIYAATTEAQLPDNGFVYGKAKLWGKIVPGECGVRAQYAYPSEFEVPAELADHPGLKAFGVPIKVSDRATRKANGGLAALVNTNTTLWTQTLPEKRGWPLWMKLALVANLAACALNLTLAALH